VLSVTPIVTNISFLSNPRPGGWDKVNPSPVATTLLLSFNVVESTYSNVVPLTQKNRKSEIARMLSGEIITDAALKQAKSLLDPQ